MLEFEEYFSIQIFFIILRETLETAIIISVLLSFINQRSAGVKPCHQDDKFFKIQKKMKLQVWTGALLGLLVCLVIGAVFIVGFYYIGQDYWSYTERLWEGVFSLLSSVIITIMGIGLLRINKIMKVKWWMKLGEAYNAGEVSAANGASVANEARNASGDGATSSTNSANDTDQDIAKVFDEDDSVIGAERTSIDSQDHLLRKPKHTSFNKKYFLAILPFVTTLREGLEAVVFIGGIGMSLPPTSIPLSILAGVSVGSTIGYMLYKGGNKLSLQYFLIFSTCFLYVVSAGLMSRGVWFLELESFVRKCGGLDVSETGSGPGSYDISKSVWHVNCCNGLTDGWWMVLNAVVGWTNSATYGSVGSYIAYWLLVILWLEVKLYEEKQGYLPVIPIKWQLKRIKKKVKLYEIRQNQSELTNMNHQPNESISNDADEREAEAQLLLA